jgi:N-acetylglucosaminyl-diphospho-decaprenol L-rhamnosyltransferase
MPSGTDSPVADVAVIVVSTNEAHWLEPCLSTVFERAGDATLDVVVVDNSSTDGTRELVEMKFPQARVVTCPNRGFAHANNRGAMTCTARYVLFLNPDTEMADGTFGALVTELDRRPEIGMAGVRQYTADGTLYPTIRNFPSVTRALGDAVGAERWRSRPNWMGERELDMSRYASESVCDWVSGSFMFCRREALFSAGLMDERFFLDQEEPDLCLRFHRAGWQVLYTTTMSIVHHWGKAGVRPKMVAQNAYTRRQYARKHFSAPRRAAYMAAVFTGHALRAAAPARGNPSDAEAVRSGAVWAMKTLMSQQPVYAEPPPTAIAAPSR